MAKKKTEIYLGTGRRKSSVARVFLKAGKGSIIVNDQDVNEYMPYQTLVMDLKQPLTLLDVADKFDVVANVHGGGFTGQAGAIRLGIARALLLKKRECLPVMLALKNVKNTVLKVQDALHNSRNGNIKIRLSLGQTLALFLLFFKYPLSFR